MDILELHERAGRQFGDLVKAVDAVRWGAPTPCPEWDVRALVDHLVRWDLCVAPMLDGVPGVEAVDALDADLLDDDPVGAWERSLEASVAAFARPGALGVVVHHPVGDVPGERFAFFRLNEYLIHAWDLARALGIDVRLDPELVEVSYRFMKPAAERLPRTGLFAAAPPLPPGADRQAEVLALHGRNPFA